MLKILDKYLLKEVFYFFAIFSIISLPFIALGNVLIANNNVLSLLFQTLYAYGQIYHIIFFISICIAIKKIRIKDGDAAFLTIGFELKELWRIVIISFVYVVFFYLFFIIPVTEQCFPKFLNNKQWMVKEHNDITIYIPELSDAGICCIVKGDKCIYVKYSYKDNKLHVNNQTIEIDKNEIYYNWNHVKFLSYRFLRQFKQYTKSRKLPDNSITINEHIFYAKICSFLILIILAFLLSFSSGNLKIILILFFYIWCEQVSYIYCNIYLIWLHLFIWSFYMLIFNNEYIMYICYIKLYKFLRTKK